MSDSHWECPLCSLKECDTELVEDIDFSSNDLIDTLCQPDVSPLDVCTISPIFCHLNVQSLLPKMDELRAVLNDTKRPVILGVSETWLNSTVLDAEISISKYNTYRKDRDGRGVDVMVYVPDRCRCRQRPDLEEEEVEIVWLEPHMRKRVFLLGNIYRPPRADSVIIEALGSMLERVTAERKEVVLMGDLNCNLMSSSPHVDELLLLTGDHNLLQLISEPTRITNHSRSLIDVFFNSNPDMFSATGTISLTNSDHLMIYGECTGRLSGPHVGVSNVRSYKSCRTEDLLSDLHDALGN